MKEEYDMDTSSELSNVETSSVYKEFSHSFLDEFLERDVTISARFRKPTKAEFNLMQSSAVKSPEAASNNLLLSVIHKSDKEKFLADTDDYPGVIVTIATVILKSSGFSEKLGKS